MSLPDKWVEIAFRTDATDGSPLWRDVTADVQWPRGVRIARRRSNELDDLQPGTMSFGLDNPSGDYTPGRAASIHYPYVKVNRQVRFRSRWPISANMVLEGQAKTNSTTLFSSSQGTLAVDLGVVASGQTSSIRWDTGTLGSTGQQLRLGSSVTTTATSQAISVTVGLSYTVSCQVRRDASLALSVNARLRWYDGTGAFLSESTGSAVALSTSFQSATCTATAPANAVWARLVIANTTTTAGTVAVYVGAIQFEQAGSATAWVSPGVEYMRFVGKINDPTASWQNGVLGQVAITATDLFKALDKDTVTRWGIGPAAGPAILALNPEIYYPLDEPAGSTGAVNAGSVAQTNLVDLTAGSGGSLTFGDTYGTRLTPLSASNGQFLGLNPVSGYGSAQYLLSLMAWVVIDSPLAGSNIIVARGLLDQSETVKVMYDTTGNQLRIFVRRVGDSATHVSSAVSIEDGVPHLIAATMSITGASVPATLEIKTYVDGAFVSSQTFSWSATSPPQANWLWAGGTQDSAPDDPQLFNGVLSHVAAWSRVLSAAEITAAYGGGPIPSSELSGARAARLLEQFGVVGAADAGQSIVGAQESSTYLGALKLVARSEAGLFFVARDGISTFHDRTRRLMGSPTFTVTADQLAVDLSFVLNDQMLFNTITVTGLGPQVTATDAASVDEHGTYPRPVATALVASQDVTDRAAIMLATYAQPAVRPGLVSVEGQFNPSLWPSLLGSEINQMIGITGLPSDAPYSSTNVWAEGVQDVITDERWVFTFDASPVNIVAYMVLDDPVLGLLDSNILGW